MAKGLHKHLSPDLGLFLLRLAIGVMFVYHGYGKLTNIEQTAGFLGMLGFPATTFFAYLLGLTELLGGLLLIAGIATCGAAAALSIVMIVAILTAHRNGPFSSVEFPLVVLGGLLALCSMGGGKWSLWNAPCCKGGCGSCGDGGSCKDGSCEEKKDGCGCGGSGSCGCGEKK